MVGDIYFVPYPYDKDRYLKKKLGITNADIANLFGLKEKAYYYSSARKRYEESLIRIYYFFLEGSEKEKKKN